MQASKDGHAERRDYYILGGLVLFALLLRLWGLNQPLWYDEIQTLETHIGTPWGEMMQSYSMNHHYLYSFQAKVFAALFGESAWAIRMPAVLFGTGTVAAIWWLAKSLAGVRIAHVVALLVALSYHQIWFSQNARGYTELAFWSTLAFGLFLHGVRSPTPKVWIAYGVTVACALATHLTGAFFFLAHGLVWLALLVPVLRARGLNDPLVKWPTLGFAVAGLLTLLFYAPVLSTMFEVAGTVGEDEAASQVVEQFNNPIWTVLEGIQTAIGSAGPLIAIIALGAVIVIGLGAVSLWTREKLYPIIVLLHIFLTVTLLTAIGMRIWPRFFFVDIALLMLLIVVGVQFAIEIFTARVKLASPQLLFSIAVAAMTLLSVALAVRNYTAPKQDLAGAYELVEALRTPADQVYGVGIGAEIFRIHMNADWTEVVNAEDFEAALNNGQRQYFVVAFPGRTFSEIPDMQTRFDSGELTEIAYLPGTLGDGGVSVLQRN